MKLLFTCIILIFSIYMDKAYSYGESNGGYPNALERESHNLLNLVRMFPTNYKNDYMKGYSNMDNVLAPSVYPATKPVWYNYTINRASRSHSDDMANNDCFQHNSCDGTSWGDRMKSFINCPGAGSQGENIAAGTATALKTNNLLLCDSPTGNSACANDGSSSDGHRKNMLNSNYANVGVGYTTSKKAKYSSYWTQDFASGSCSLPTTPIYSGFHTIYPETNPQFIAIYYNLSMPSTGMSLVFVDDGDETTVKMSIMYGNPTAAAYMVATNFTFCRQYYFLAETSDETYRYPDTGFLQLTTNSSCEGFSTGDAFSTSKSISFSILIVLSLILVLLF